MKSEIQLIKDFIKLTNTRPDIFSEQDRNEIEAIFNSIINTGLLFSEQDRNEIEAIFNSLANDDVEGLADEIDKWCTSHPVIDDALDVLLTSQSCNLLASQSGRRAAGGKFPTDKTKAEEEKNLKETLINELRKSSPPETQKPNTPKG
ncbi:hypothetical protein [Moorena bouillonii]|uniref:Uncharacterized protein n=1 Tax=Moorena bouillonii PNG TaxID=568701 RepID=A0A1U7MWP5_9CYAN|nr:hypothetical protein [Moorena bouillonii]NEQ80459.1 hypothetical protein [Moorena sp. SIO2I5]OLT58084.1 hypothetical protein BJP37_02520 [Moorena bouillonii PNG]